MLLSTPSARLPLRRWPLSTHSFWLRLALVVALLISALNVSSVLSQVQPGASLTVVRGSVSVTREDGTAIYPAGTGLTLAIGDVVGTLERTRAIVTFFSGSEVELGSNTTIVIRRLDRDLLDQANVTIEHLSGATLIRVPTDAGPNPGVRILANGTVATVKAGEIGHGVDPTSNNVTVACVESNEVRCSRDSTTFPNATTFLLGQTALTFTGAGDLIPFRVLRTSSIWDVLAEGAAIGQSDGTDSQPNSNREQNTDKKDREKEQEEDSNRPQSQPQPQPRFQPIVGPPTATPTRTPTLTSTLTPTVTPTPTITPTATITPRPGAACNTPQTAVGSSGVFTFSHDLGRTSGVVHLEWNAFTVADQFEIVYQGVTLFSTFNPVTGLPLVTGIGSVDRPFGPGLSTVIVIRVTTGTGSTQWQYQVSCLP